MGFCYGASRDRRTDAAIEVRHKVVLLNDIHIFGKSCADKEVQDAAVVMVHDEQPAIDEEALALWVSKCGIGMTLFKGWSGLVEQVLYWSETPKPAAAAQAVRFIHERLIAVETSSDALDRWTQLTQSAQVQGGD